MPEEHSLWKSTVTVAVPCDTPRIWALRTDPFVELESTATTAGSVEVGPPSHPPSGPPYAATSVKVTDSTDPTATHAVAGATDTLTGDGVGAQLPGRDFGPTTGAPVVVVTGKVVVDDPVGRVVEPFDEGTDVSDGLVPGVGVVPGVVPAPGDPAESADRWREPPSKVEMSTSEVTSATMTAAAAMREEEGTNRVQRLRADWRIEGPVTDQSEVAGVSSTSRMIRFTSLPSSSSIVGTLDLPRLRAAQHLRRPAVTPADPGLHRPLRSGHVGGDLRDRVPESIVEDDRPRLVSRE